MPILVQWDDEPKTIINCIFNDPWNWDEFDTMVEETDLMIESVTQHPVDMIFDLTNGQRLPSNALGQFRKISRKEASYLGVIVLVRVSPFMQLIGDILDRLYPRWTKRMRLARTIEEARILINQIRTNRHGKV